MDIANLLLLADLPPNPPPGGMTPRFLDLWIAWAAVGVACGLVSLKLLPRGGWLTHGLLVVVALFVAAPLVWRQTAVRQAEAVRLQAEYEDYLHRRHSDRQRQFDERFRPLPIPAPDPFPPPPALPED